MFAEELRRAIEAAARITLPQVAALLWRAYGDGQVTEAEAGALSALIEARTVAPALRRAEPAMPPAEGGAMTTSPSDASRDRQNSPRTGVGSRPRTDASLTRRRTWAASGRLPPALAARFTLAEQAVLALVAAETARRKDCRLAIEHMAAVAGVSRSTVKNALREARQLGLLTVEERRLTGFRNDTNVVRAVSPEWTAWLRLTRKGRPSRIGSASYPSPTQGGGVKSSAPTPTQVLNPGKARPARPPNRGRQTGRHLSRPTSRTVGA